MTFPCISQLRTIFPLDFFQLKMQTGCNLAYNTISQPILSFFLPSSSKIFQSVGITVTVVGVVVFFFPPGNQSSQCRVRLLSSQQTKLNNFCLF